MSQVPNILFCPPAFSFAENTRLYLLSWVSYTNKQQACWHLTTGHQGSSFLNVFKYSVARSKYWCCQKWNMDVHVLQLLVIMGCFTWNEKQSRVSHVRISAAFSLCFTASCLHLWKLYIAFEHPEHYAQIIKDKLLNEYMETISKHENLTS